MLQPPCATRFASTYEAEIAWLAVARRLGRENRMARSDLRLARTSWGEKVWADDDTETEDEDTPRPRTRQERGRGGHRDRGHRDRVGSEASPWPSTTETPGAPVQTVWPTIYRGDNVLAQARNSLASELTRRGGSIPDAPRRPQPSPGGIYVCDRIPDDPPGPGGIYVCDTATEDEEEDAAAGPKPPPAGPSRRRRAETEDEEDAETERGRRAQAAAAGPKPPAHPPPWWLRSRADHEEAS